MFCPSCRTEYIDGITACSDCGAALAVTLPPIPGSKRETELELATVLETGDPFLITRAKSVLDGADIRYLVKGEGLQDLFGLGRIGTGYNQVVGPVQLQVRKDQERLARRLIEEIDTAVPDDAETGASGRV